MPLIAPYGGTLVNLVAGAEEKAELIRRAAELPSLQLDARSLVDLELLATGAYSPLDRFMGRADAERTAAEMRLTGGALFPVPITLAAERVEDLDGREIALRNARNNLVATMTVEEIFEWSDPAETMSGSARYRLSGPLRALELPPHSDFPALRRTPAVLRALLSTMGRDNVVVFQPRHAIHRAQEELIRRVARELDGTLLIQPLVGMVQPGDIGHYSRMRIYRQLVETHFDPGRTVLNLAPLPAREADAREILRQTVVQRNYGANYMIVDESQVQEVVSHQGAEIGVQALRPALPPGTRLLPENEVRDQYLALGKPLPEWFTRPETAAILAEICPPRNRQGFCIWFTGLPSSGKSTVAEALIVMLMEHGRQVTMLDGDVVRTHLSKGLGFSKEDRDTNILRVGFVASEIVRHNGAVICAAVSPYRHTRDQVRAAVSQGAHRDDAFIEVFVDTPQAECERRDVKGYYARAREGKITGFTGVDDPYEPPPTPEIRLSTSDATAAQNAGRIVEFLRTRGLIS